MKIKIPKATVKPDKKVLSLFLRMVSKISCQRSLLNMIPNNNLVNVLVFNNDPIF